MFGGLTGLGNLYRTNATCNTASWIHVVWCAFIHCKWHRQIYFCRLRLRCNPLFFWRLQKSKLQLYIQSRATVGRSEVWTLTYVGHSRHCAVIHWQRDPNDSKGLQCWTMHGRPCAVQKPNKEEQWIWSYSLTTETVSRCPFLSFRGESYTHNAQNLQQPALWRPTFWLHCELIKLHSVRNKLE